MPKRIIRLAYFERWIDPVAEEILAREDGIEMLRLCYADPVAETDAKMRSVQAYQISPRTELLGPYLGDAALLDKCPDLLAISSTGAGYDMVDVADCTAAGVLVCTSRAPMPTPSPNMRSD